MRAIEDIVALVKHKGDLSAFSRAETLKEAMDLIGGFGRLRSPFIVKVNLCTHPLWDITRFGTTSPKMCEALVSLALKEDKDLSIKIVESDSNDKFMDEATFKKYGYKDLEERFGELGFNVSLVNLSQPPLVKVRFDGLYFKELELHKMLTERGYFVSMAMAKTHFTVVSGVIKNLFGLLPRKGKGFYHPRDGSIDFNDVLTDLNRFANPRPLHHRCDSRT